ncbi:MAG: hypothetical protein U0325_28060 [Polyangiales bacterium]
MARDALTPLRAITRTIRRTLGMLRDQGLGALRPLFVLLVLLALLLWAINTLAPLAPFVYSLF